MHHKTTLIYQIDGHEPVVPFTSVLDLMIPVGPSNLEYSVIL